MARGAQKPLEKTAQIPAKVVKVGRHAEAEAIMGAQGQQLIPLITQSKNGSMQLGAGMVYMPPGRYARAHLHKDNEMIVMVVEGYAVTLIGEEMEPVFHGPGEFLFIPEGVPHVAVNLSPDHRLIAFEVRADPHFNEDLELVPHLEDKAAAIVKKLQADFKSGKLKHPEHWDTNDKRPFTFAD